MKYDAFISYRHGGIDQVVAGTLHKQMESFKLPKSVQGKGNGKTKISRVFRDKEELPLSSDLEDNIKEALSESEWLIVICTKRLKESKWCMKEIDTFIELHGQDHILAVLVEGEPYESFPEQLLSRKVKTIDENGNEIIIKKDVEPMAADVRGDDEAQVVKNIKSEKLRILAPIFALDYDDLKQRERERRIKRIVTVSASVVSVSLAFAIFSTAMFLKIRNQKIEIEQKAQEIEQQNQIILEDKAKIDSQNESLKLSQAKTAGKQAIDFVMADRKDLAREKAYEALTCMDGIDMPYNSYAHLALASALDVYDYSLSYMSVHDVYNLDSVIYTMAISDKADYLAALVETQEGYAVRIIDSATKEVIDSIEDDCSTYTKLLFMPDDSLVITGNTNAKVYQISKAKATYLYEFPIGMRACDLMYSDEMDRLVSMSTECVTVVNPKNGTNVSIKSEKDTVICGATKDGKYMLQYNKDTNTILQIDSLTNEKIQVTVPKEVILDSESPIFFTAMEHEGDMIYFYSNLPNGINGINTMAFSMTKTGVLNWQKSYSLNIRDFVKLPDSSVIAGVASLDLFAIDLQNGELIDLAVFDSNCAHYHATSGGRLIIYSTYGSYYIWNQTIGLVQYEGSGLDYNRNRMDVMIRTQGEVGISYFILPNGSNSIYVYGNHEPTDIDKIEIEAISSAKQKSELFTMSEAKKLANQYQLPDATSIDKLVQINDKNIAIAMGAGKLYVVNMLNNEVLYSLDGIHDLFFYLTDDYATDESGNLYVFCSRSALAFDQNFELVGLLYGACDFDSNTQQIIYKYSDLQYYADKLYSVEELLDKVKE